MNTNTPRKSSKGHSFRWAEWGGPRCWSNYKWIDDRNWRSPKRTGYPFPVGAQASRRWFGFCFGPSSVQRVRDSTRGTPRIPSGTHIFRVWHTSHAFADGEALPKCVFSDPHCRHFTMFFQKISENMQWKDTLFHKNKCRKTYYIFFPITFWTGQSASRKHHFLNENIQNVFRTCFCRKRVSFISMFFNIT